MAYTFRELDMNDYHPLETQSEAAQARQCQTPHATRATGAAARPQGVEGKAEAPATGRR